MEYVEPGIVVHTFNSSTGRWISVSLRLVKAIEGELVSKKKKKNICDVLYPLLGDFMKRLILHHL